MGLILTGNIQVCSRPSKTIRYLSCVVGAPDIPDIPAGSADDGLNYLKFLTVVRQSLPKEKTLSIAAPASYWYLKGFPIERISRIVDYIVYMTYDLHGVSCITLKTKKKIR
jgi:GH18 family chitinase